MGLEGKAALITGAGRNIGRAIALELARQGADVAVNARSNQDEFERTADEVRRLGAQAVALVGDLGSGVDVRRVVLQAEEALGHVDILVNTPAFRPSQPFLEITDQDWERVLAVNLHGPFHACQSVLPGMVERRWGRIINFSGLGVFTGATRRAHVMASKTGILGLTRGLALEFARSGITVNAVAPGWFETERIGEWHEKSGSWRPGQGIVHPKGAPPVGRFGDPQEVADLCVFLASDRAAFITGQVLHVNGGDFVT